jgi:phage N-6-adenine-methyltransferase
MFSSKTDLWETPKDFFDKMNDEFHFNLDVCATHENAKCEAYYTKEIDGLNQPWYGRCWCNPPYGREIGKWVEKAYKSATDGATVVMLLPAKTDTKWFHKYIYGKAEVRFIRGRLKFGGSKNSAPFPSMVVVFNGKNNDIYENEQQDHFRGATKMMPEDHIR